MSDGHLPPKPEDALPDSTEPHGPYPRCGRLSNFTHEGSAPLTFDGSSFSLSPDGTQNRSFVERLSILQWLFVVGGDGVGSRR